MQDIWLKKHADYQRVYREGRRQSLPLMTYFYALRRPDAAGSQPLCAEISPHRSATPLPAGARVGLTTGRVLGNAVERNRIKRRMRAVVRQHRTELTAAVDVILHPRRTVLEAEYAAIERDVERALRTVQTLADTATRTGDVLPGEPPRQRKPASAAKPVGAGRKSSQ